MSRSYRVAMVAACPFPFPRGTPIRILREAEALSRLGHEVHLVTYHLGDAPGEVPFRIHRIRDVRGYRKTSPGPSYRKLFQLDYLLSRRLLEVVCRHDIDVIHAHHYEGLLAGMFARNGTGIPLLYDAHTLLRSELPSYRLGIPPRMLGAAGRLLDRVLPRRADRIVAVSQEIRDALVENGAARPDEIVVVPNGVELERFRTQGDAPARGEGPLLIFTGNLAPYQGIDLLLRCIRIVADRREDVKVRIVADSPFDAYEGLARELNVRDRITLLQSDFDHLPSYLAQADVALNPRIDCAGVPQKLLNYMAAARPIVSFEGSGRILEHGRTGWLAAGGDVAAFAGGVLHLLENHHLARSLGNAARDVVASRFTWERSAAQVENTYHLIAG